MMAKQPRLGSRRCEGPNAPKLYSARYWVRLRTHSFSLYYRLVTKCLRCSADSSAYELRADSLNLPTPLTHSMLSQPGFRPTHMYDPPLMLRT